MKGRWRRGEVPPTDGKDTPQIHPPTSVPPRSSLSSLYYRTAPIRYSDSIPTPIHVMIRSVPRPISQRYGGAPRAAAPGAAQRTWIDACPTTRVASATQTTSWTPAHASARDQFRWRRSQQPSRAAYCCAAHERSEPGRDPLPSDIPGRALDDTQSSGARDAVAHTLCSRLEAANRAGRGCSGTGCGRSAGLPG
jgi:hypothetical protein